MTFQPLLLGAAAAALVSGSVLVPAPAHARTGPPPVTSVVRLETRPDVAAAFGLDVAGFRVQAAASLNRSATEQRGTLTPETAIRLGRPVYYRPEDVELYAVPARRQSERAGSMSYAVIAVPLHSTVYPDGSVSPPLPVPALPGVPTGSALPTGSAGPAGPTGSAASPVLVDPTFSPTWGVEAYFNWVYFDLDDGGFWCTDTRGEVRGQWEYARLPNVVAWSPYEYWGVAQRAIAEITHPAKGCENSIDRFDVAVQSLTTGSYPARQSPLSMAEGKCDTKVLMVGGSFSGINASITQTVERCERWTVIGALKGSATEWYGIRYDHRGIWNKPQREAAALEVVRLPRGAGHGLHMALFLDVDNRR